MAPGVLLTEKQQVLRARDWAETGRGAGRSHYPACCCPRLRPHISHLHHSHQQQAGAHNGRRALLSQCPSEPPAGGRVSKATIGTHTTTDRTYGRSWRAWGPLWPKQTTRPLQEGRARRVKLVWTPALSQAPRILCPTAWFLPGLDGWLRSWEAWPRCPLTLRPLLTPFLSTLVLGIRGRACLELRVGTEDIASDPARTGGARPLPQKQHSSTPLPGALRPVLVWGCLEPQRTLMGAPIPGLAEYRVQGAGSGETSSPVGTQDLVLWPFWPRAAHSQVVHGPTS